MTKRRLFVFLIIALFVELPTVTVAQIVTSKVYGDGSTYCAFTSLIKKDSIYYLAFREAQTHVSEGDFGVIKILTSVDGEKWVVFQTISKPNVDLRDPNLSVSPKGAVILLCGARMKHNQGYYITKTLFADMKRGGFSSLQNISLPDSLDDKYCAWCWRLSWTGKTGYTIEYQHYGKNQKVDLLKTKDGKKYKWVASLDVPNVPSEGVVRVAEDGKMTAVVRTSKNGFIGHSTYPYKQWQWEEIPLFVGAHDVSIEDYKFVCASRKHTSQGSKTCVYYGSPNNNPFSRSVLLPSGGDTGYCSVLKVEDEWWVSYYSSHESQKPSIFLAKIPDKMLLF